MWTEKLSPGSRSGWTERTVGLQSRWTGREVVCMHYEKYLIWRAYFSFQRLTQAQSTGRFDQDSTRELMFLRRLKLDIRVFALIFVMHVRLCQKHATRGRRTAELGPPAFLIAIS